MAPIPILFVTYNSAAVIGAALDSLPDGHPVLVVDNASDDDTVTVCRERGIEVLALPENIGYGAAANAGIRRSDADYVFLLNPDIVLEEDCLQALQAAADCHPRVGLFGPSQFRRDAGRKVDHDKPTSLLVPPERTGKTLSQNVLEVDFLLGSAYFIRRRAFDEIGGFDEQIFLFYEDDDFCRRLRDAGWGRALVTNALCQHAIGRSSPVTAALVYAKNWHIAWSQCYALRKHDMPVRHVRGIVQNALKVLLHLFSGNRMKRAKAAGALAGRSAFISGVRARDRRIEKGRLNGG